MSTYRDPIVDEVLWPDTPFKLSTTMILAGKRGSEAHGTYLPPTDPTSIDDRDIMGVCVLPITYYLGLDKWEHAESIKGPWDVVLYEFRKYIGLLCQQNPNVLSLLWLEPEDYLLTTEAGRLLIAHRHLFRCRKRAFESFLGYARGQLKRMTSFGEFKGYMGAKRKGLVEKFGWDTKNGAHLVRLLHMGHEYLTSGVLQVRRTDDAPFLIAIKRGEVPLAAVQAEAERFFAACENAYDHSPLPAELPWPAINTLMLGIFDAVRDGSHP